MILSFFNDTATTEIYTLSLHERSSDLVVGTLRYHRRAGKRAAELREGMAAHKIARSGPSIVPDIPRVKSRGAQDRKSTRLNSSHVEISYAVFCLKKKKKNKKRPR